MFDVNTVYKFEHAFAGQTYVYEQENVYCVWENVYHPRTRRCDFVLDFFEKEKNGMYSRKTEVQTQRAWSDRTLQNTLHQSGFAIRLYRFATDAGWKNGFATLLCLSKADGRS